MFNDFQVTNSPTLKVSQAESAIKNNPLKICEDSRYDIKERNSPKKDINEVRVSSSAQQLKNIMSIDEEILVEK